MNPCQQEKVLSLERKITIQTMDILCLEKIVKTQVAVIEEASEEIRSLKDTVKTQGK